MVEIETILDKGLKQGVEFIDIRLENVKTLSIRLINGTLRESTTGFRKSAGIRAFYKGAWGFASTSSFDKESIEKAVLDAAKLAYLSAESKKEKFNLEKKTIEGGKKVVEQKLKFESVPIEEKISLLTDAEKIARMVSNKVVNTNLYYLEEEEEVEVYNTYGLHSWFKIPRAVLYSSIYASSAGIIERAFESVGGTGGYEIVKDSANIAEKSAKRAVELLGAKPAPAGKYQAVIDPKLAGVFIHEAFGHACEADLVLSRNSILEGRLGEKVGNEIVNAVDDPTIPGLYGSYPFDSEGTPSRKKYLVKNGILNSFMHNIETSSRMNVENTGNGRAMSSNHPPIVRMSNTYIDKGDWDPEELISETKNGVYVKGSLYGYTDPSKGEFMFKAEEGWLIEGGDLKEHLREVAISGLTLEVLGKIDAIARDLTYTPGHCGKSGQSVPVTTGAPHIRVKEIVLGGLR